MSASFKIATVVGARPQFIKAAAFSRMLKNFSEFQEIIIHTGQHFSEAMSDVFFRELDISPPAYHLNIGGISHGHMTGRMVEEIEDILRREQFQALLVYGDTNSTLAGALAAVKLHLPIIHIEAGLRSHNRKMPEEINRVLTDHMSSLLLCPTHQAVKNLHKEGLKEGVFHVGDVMYDATLFARQRAGNKASIIETMGIEKPYCVVTIHRAENTSNSCQLKKILNFVKDEARRQNLTIVFPLHPRTKKMIEASQTSLKEICVIEPLGYFDMQALLSHSTCILTDSGGVQKEAYFHRVPCITLRDETEWVETIESGWNRLWSAPLNPIPLTNISDYGEGSSTTHMIQTIKKFFSL